MEMTGERVAACPKCEGLGYYYDSRVVAGTIGESKICGCVEAECRCGGRPPYQHFDKAFEAHWCPCRRYRQRLRGVQQLFADANVPKKYQWKFIDDFKETGRDGSPIRGARQLKGTVSSLVDNCMEGKTPRGIMLHGRPGNGKTLLGCIALNELMFKCALPGKFLDLSLQYFEKLRSTYNEESGRYGQTWAILEELSTLPCLVIDDFGVQRNTEWELEMLYNLVDTRYEYERLTLVTTNKSIEEVKQQHEGRIYSRLQEMCRIIPVDSPDYRETISQFLGAKRYAGGQDPA